MSNKSIIHTDQAPEAVGTYSQAVKAGSMVFISGQISIDPATGQMKQNTIEEEIDQVFKNLTAVIKASGATVQDVVKLNLSLTNMDDFAVVNEVMSQYFSQPYPARAAVGVASLPKGANFEAEAIVVV